MSNTCGMRCKYYTERFLGWCLNNKTIVVLTLLSFSLFVSTLTIAGQRNRLQTRYSELEASLVTPEPAAPTTSDPIITTPETEINTVPPPPPPPNPEEGGEDTDANENLNPPEQEGISDPPSPEAAVEETDDNTNIESPGQRDNSKDNNEKSTNVRSRRMIMGRSG